MQVKTTLKLVTLFGLLLVANLASAQREYYQWRFGERAGLTFAVDGPAVVAGVPQSLRDGSACIAAETGELLLLSDGRQVWNGQGELLPGLVVRGELGYQQSRRQVLAVRQPGQSARYYLFRNSGVQRFPYNAESARYLPYAVVDMRARDGRGAIVHNDSIQITNYRLALWSMLSLNTNLVPIRHANGFDWWIVGQNVEGQFLSYLLSSTGVNPHPVISQPARPLTFNNGILRASTDGRTLALTTQEDSTKTAHTSIEVARFDPATGTVLDYYVAKRWPAIVQQTSPNGWSISYTQVGGLEMSPDGAALYADIVGGNTLMRFDLRAGSPAAVRASCHPVSSSSGARVGMAGDMQVGPDGDIYVNQDNAYWLGRIRQPGATNPDAPYESGALVLPGPAHTLESLPFALYDPSMPQLQLYAGSSAGCQGNPVRFGARLGAALTGRPITWDFGDATAPALSTATTAEHMYAAPGTYTVTLTVTNAAGLPVQVSQTVVISGPPVVSLGAPTRQLCAGQSVVLSPGPQPAGTTYLWHDGSTRSTFEARQDGPVTVDVTNAQGCQSRASMVVELLPSPHAFLGPDTTVCLEKQPLQLHVSLPQPPGTTYRWQDGSTAEALWVGQPGRYELEVRAPSGCSERAAVVVRDGNCPVVMPNIITPNQDALNDFFVLKGLVAADWQLAIYNRWGRLIYQASHYDNAWNAAGQPDGVYFYLLRKAGTGLVYKGQVEVVR